MWLPRRIIVLLMQRDGEDFTGWSAGHIAAGFWMLGTRWPRWQRVPIVLTPVFIAEDRRRTIALMHIAIHRHGALDGAIAQQPADGHRYIVNHAKAFAVVGKGMVKTAP